MGTIIKRRRKNGTIAWLAQISVMRQGKVLLRESQTFERRSTAAAWIENREESLARPGALDALKTQPKSKKTPTLADAIDRYVQESNKQIGRTKTQVLKSIKTFDIADQHCDAITSADIVEFAQEKLNSGVQPQTVANYLSHLGAVFSIARPAWGFPLSAQAMEDARKVADKLGITGKSRERDRRPTLDELDRLMQHFLDRSRRRPTSIPMHRIIAFAIFSTRRQEEIVRIRWKDLDVEGKRILVRDMKNPGEKIGNDVWCGLQEQALAIIEAMPLIEDEIFPYSTDAISAAFTRACKFLEIKGLHFHDLRHDGVSRLFELGLNIPYVAANSGHRSWTSLKRYTHLRQTGDKYADWTWLAEVTKRDNALKLVRNGQFPRKRRSDRGV
ncbi:site-specific integrase [Planktotalea arctica]|uniref:site-specific integrase n=1 Tax=Planktotalea arctica TaxID=1481893 RepID=UPI000A176A56|nr:site-specific integrase [Planktotalea arctica]